MIATTLTVRPQPRIVPDGVFDAWSWCASDTLEWRRVRDIDARARVDASNPAGLVFVMHAECSFLPRELAWLHAPGYGLTSEWALAPWAIDDATDLLYEHRVRPRDTLWVAADTLPALVWGLHDWAHFHNHGPFDQPAMTELQCDLVALAWLNDNRDAIGLRVADVAAVARDLARLSHERFAGEGRVAPADLLEAFDRFSR